MALTVSRLASSSALALLLSSGVLVTQAAAQDSEEPTDLGTIVLSAEEQIKQALGASTISAEDLEKSPVVNDVSEIIRKMPGVNLTGTTASGQRGNQRQIDIRGMGPENTLILIDGKPVMSRNSVRMGRSGERDSRGDSNWVPAEMIERIEVLRGPAASRYGSGAAGGVVNIITKRPDTQTASIGLHYNAPEDSAEGASQRANLLIAGPLGEKLSYRVYGNWNRSDADAPDINDDAVAEAGGTRQPAGREGVNNRDVGALLTWEIDGENSLDFELTYGRQGNIYTGDTQNSNADTVNGIVNELADAGAETNSLRRRVFSLTHRGDYSFGTSNTYLQLEKTSNTRNLEAGAGGPEGSINSAEKATIDLDNIALKSEWIMPFMVAGKNQTLTLGAEFRQEKKHDPASLRQTVIGGVEIPGTETDVSKRKIDSKQSILALYAESNIEWNEQLMLTPSLRFDHSTSFGTQLSPGLNATYAINDSWTMKLGVAKAFKAPNLFQLDPDYVYYTRGNGCPIDYPANGGVGCYVVGNPDLKAETALNSEIGFAYESLDSGLSGSLTYFHSDYTNRISSGMVPVTDAADPGTGAGHVLRWENTPEAVVAGLEGNIAYVLNDQFTLSANFTKMTESKNKQNGQPLSLIPEHTVNAAVEYRPTEALIFTLSATHYGKIEAAKLSATTGGPSDSTDARASYALVNLGASYQLSDAARVSLGVTNLFDKQLYRTGLGANTFNEPGRAVYLSLNTNF